MMQKREPYSSPTMGKIEQETGSLQADIRRCQYWILDAAPEGKWVLLEE